MNIYIYNQSQIFHGVQRQNDSVAEGEHAGCFESPLPTLR